MVRSSSQNDDRPNRRTARIAVLGKLASGVAHDFNNVLQIITANGTMVLASPNDIARVCQCVKRMLDAAERASNINNRLLSFTRYDTHPKHPLDINSVLVSIQDLVEPLLPANIVVQTIVEPDLPLIAAETSEFETVLVNLIVNARDAMMTKGGIIIVSAQISPILDHAVLTSGDYVKISVKDTGIGMDADLIVQVTEPFFTTKPKGSGTGLGLSLACEFAEQAHGTLEIISTPTVSTEVSIWLPVVLPPQP
jgi:signal transduction histidine kinase